MKSIHHFSIALAIAATAATASAAFPYTETFSIANDNAGWTEFALADSSTFGQNPATEQLDFSATNYSLFFLSAGDTASLGAFTGDYTTFPIDQLSFELTLGAGSTVTDLYVQLTNFTEDETWQYLLTPNAAGTTAIFDVPTTLSGAGWTQVSGDQTFAFLLADVEDLSIVLGGSANVSGALDNVTAVPEPSSAVLCALGSLGLLRRRRAR
jgi:hypothetical protein